MMRWIVVAALLTTTPACSSGRPDCPPPGIVEPPGVVTPPIALPEGVTNVDVCVGGTCEHGRPYRDGFRFDNSRLRVFATVEHGTIRLDIRSPPLVDGEHYWIALENDYTAIGGGAWRATYSYPTMPRACGARAAATKFEPIPTCQGCTKLDWTPLGRSSG